MKKQHISSAFYKTAGLKNFILRSGLPEHVKISPNGIKTEISGKTIGKIAFGDEITDPDFVYDMFHDQDWNEFAEWKSSGILIEFNPISVIGYVLSGVFERECGASGIDLSDIGTEPYLDKFENWIINLVAEIHHERDLPFLAKSFPFSVCLSHDVDEMRQTYQYMTSALRYTMNGQTKKSFAEVINLLTDKVKGYNPYWEFDSLMKLENEFDVRSTFFFLQESARVMLTDKKTWKHFGRRYRFSDPIVMKTIESLASDGWEIGLHGSYESYKKSELLKKEKFELEGILKNKISGVRQHNLNLSIPETWIYQNDLGFEYDSSLGFRSYEGIGFRWGTCRPFHPFDAEGKLLDLIEIPLIIMDISLRKYGRDVRSSMSSIMDRCESVNGIMNVLWHHVFFCERDFPEWIETYRWIIEAGKKRGARFLTLREACDIWKKREEGRLKIDYSEKERVSVRSDYPYLTLIHPEGVKNIYKNSIPEKVTIESFETI